MTSPLIYSILLLLSTWEISSTTPTEAYEDASWIESSYSNGYKDSSHHTDGTGYNIQDHQEDPSHTGESVSTSSSNGGGGISFLYDNNYSIPNPLLANYN